MESAGKQYELIVTPIWPQYRNTDSQFIRDPTGQTDGYTISKDETGIIELKGSRGQTYQHFYNTETRKYQYQSNVLVQKAGVVDGSSWVTFEEYPIRFVVRTTDGKNHFLELDEIDNLFTTIDNSTIWSVGIESFNGLSGFYVNSDDETWGHGQAIYYPRLSDGTLPAYDMPLYSWFAHFHAEKNGINYDKIINDRSLFMKAARDPRNSFHFEVEKGVHTIWYDVKDITIFSQTFDFVFGIKYNSSEDKFHTINRVTCHTTDFDDIGFTYDITSTSRSEGTPYELSGVVLKNETHTIIKNVTTPWDANAILPDALSTVDLVSENKEVFGFSFADMEETGFTEKDLRLCDQLLPGNESRKVLRVGMHGYGRYTRKIVLDIDPLFFSEYITDTYDSCLRDNIYWDTYTKITAYNKAGFFYSSGRSSYEYRSYLNWDTSISETITEITSATLSMHCEYQNLEAGEKIRFKLLKSYSGSSPKESDPVSTLDDYWYYATYTTYVEDDPVAGATHDLNIGSLMNYWRQNKGSNTRVKFRIQYGSYCDGETHDRADYSDGADSTESDRPKLTFNFDVVLNPPVIQSFAIDSAPNYKGDAVVFKTIIHNPDKYYSYEVSAMKYTIKGYNYSNWEDWYPTCDPDETIPPLGDVEIINSIGPTFQSPIMGDRYALNTGKYQVTEVKASGERIGGGGAPWEKQYYPTAPEGEFDIDNQAGERFIFIATVYDSEFADFLSANSKTINQLFDAAQSNPIDRHNRSNDYYWPTYYNGLEDLWDIDFYLMSLENEWWDDNGNSS
ncbi:MAG: hypothetical protein ACXADA_15305, partial [Candidatus Hodarchaeales archaeon]